VRANLDRQFSPAPISPNRGGTPLAIGVSQWPPLPIRMDADNLAHGPPVLSRDGSWLAWRWAFRDPLGPLRRGTVLIDLKNREYRPLDQSWHTVTWAK
jgi:hypothetical protein